MYWAAYFELLLWMTIYNDMIVISIMEVLSFLNATN